MYKIGFIDEEELQLTIFKNKFNNDFEIYDFELNQHLTTDDLVNNIFENHLDAVIIDYRINGYFNFNGEKIVEKLNEINPFFPRIVLTSHPIEALNFVDDANIVNSKTIWNGAYELEVFIKKLNRGISSYYGRINNSEAELKSLEEKRKESNLSETEMKRYLELNNFLAKTVGEKKDLVETYYSQKTDKKLESLIEKTQAIFDKLSEK